MIPSDTVRSSLEMIVAAPSFEEASQELTEKWELEGAGSEVLEPTLRFMEVHPEIDYGSPGPLAHFIERFHGQGYDEALLASIRRSPTPHTVWLLNRLINGTPDGTAREANVRAMREVAVGQSAREDARASAIAFLKRLEG
jgi:hypothetical protein